MFGRSGTVRIPGSAKNINYMSARLVIIFVRDYRLSLGRVWLFCIDRSSYPHIPAELYRSILRYVAHQPSALRPSYELFAWAIHLYTSRSWLASTPRPPPLSHCIGARRPGQRMQSRDLTACPACYAPAYMAFMERGCHRHGHPSPCRILP